jgi:hypothetical protein
MKSDSKLDDKNKENQCKLTESENIEINNKLEIHRKSLIILTNNYFNRDENNDNNEIIIDTTIDRSFHKEKKTDN